MSNAIIFRMGADSAGFKKDLEAASQFAAREGAKMSASTKGRQKANEGLLESERKVENQLVGLAQRLTTAASAGDMMTATATALAESLNLSLGAAVGVGAAIAIADGLNKAAETARKLSDGLREVTEAGADLSSVDGITTLHSGLSAISAKLKEIQAPLGVYGTFTEGLDDMFATSSTETGKEKREKLIQEGLAQRKRLFGQVAAAQNQILDIQERILKGDELGAQLARTRLEYEAKIREMRRFAEANGGDDKDVGAVADSLRKQQAIEERKIHESEGARIEAHMAALGKMGAEDVKQQEEIERKKRASISAVAEDQAKAAMDLIRGETANAAKLADQEADAIQEKKDLATKAAADLAKEAEAQIARELALRKQADDQAAAHRKKTLAQAVAAELAGPDARREDKRKEGDRVRAENKVIRGQEAKARGGMHPKDYEKLHPQFGPPAPLTLRRSRDMKAATPGADARAKEGLTEAMNKAKITTSLESIEQQLAALRNAG